MNESYDPGWSTFANVSDTLRDVDMGISMFLGTTGILLNSITLFVLLQKDIRRKPHYSNIISLAVVDLLSCFVAICYAVIPSDVPIEDNVLGELKCRIVCSRFLYYLITGVSAWHLVMISFERYLFAMHTEWYDRHFTRRFNAFLIILCWVLSMSTMSYNLFAFKRQKTTCAFQWDSEHGFYLQKIVSIEETVVMLVLPLLIMGFFYTSVHVKLVQLHQFISTVAPLHVGIRLKPKHSLGSILSILVVYTFTWGPVEILWVLTSFHVIKGGNGFFSGTGWYMTQLLVILNVVLNPLIYACSYSDFRSALKFKFNFINNLCSSQVRTSDGAIANRLIKSSELETSNNSAGAQSSSESSDPRWSPRDANSNSVSSILHNGGSFVDSFRSIDQSIEIEI